MILAVTAGRPAGRLGGVKRLEPGDRMWGTIVLSGMTAGVTAAIWRRLEHPSATWLTFLRYWAGGVLIPVLVWAVFNAGLPLLPVFLQGAAEAFSAGNYAEFADLLAPGIRECILWQGAGVMAWALWLIMDVAPNRFELAVGWFWLFLLLCLPAFLAGLVVSLLFSTGWGGPVLALFGAVAWIQSRQHQKPFSRPTYAVAEIRALRGQFSEAEEEILRQLDAHPEDAEGWIRLAELLGRHFRELDTVEELLNQLETEQKLTPAELIRCYHKLADLHLEVSRNRDRAVQALERICLLAPDTPASVRAMRRIQGLPSQAQLDQQEPDRIQLPSSRAEHGTRPRPFDTLPFGAEGDRNYQDIPGLDERAHVLVKVLESQPGDEAAREHLAWIYARHYHRMDLARDQIELLIQSTPAQKHPGKVVHWLNSLASWEIQYEGNLEAARRTLQRIIDGYPGSTSALVARRRQGLLEQERSRR